MIPQITGMRTCLQVGILFSLSSIHSENDSPDVASKRGREFLKKIYLVDPDVDSNPTREAGPDYDYIVLGLSTLQFPIQRKIVSS